VDFFDAQDHARRLTHRLVFLFVLAVASMVAIVYLVAVVVLGVVPVEELAGVATSREGGVTFVDPGLLLAVTVGMGALIGGGAFFRTAQLRQGGSAVAELLGGRRVDPSTSDPLERVLVNVVEEMSIASGVSVPAICVMDREAGINAFAAGHTIDDAAVAVTRGTLEKLTRDELQGVIAHEFSHILNGDMRLNVRLMGLLFGILLLAVVGRGLLRGAMWGGRGRSSGGGRGSGMQVAALGGVLILLGYLGVVFGRLIQAAVSRQREFLADAAAVEFTRNPDGIAGALKRIGAAAGAGPRQSPAAGGDGSRLQDHHAQEASHLFFADGVGKAFSRLTATHPPLEERIRRVDPRWDGNWEVPPVRRKGGGRQRPEGAHPPLPDAPPRDSPGTPPVRPGGVSSAGPEVGAAALAGDSAPERRGSSAAFPARAALMASAGAPESRHVEQARALLGRIPQGLRQAARTEEGAVETMVALLLSGAPEVRERQLTRVGEGLGEATGRAALALKEGVDSLGPEGRLPLLELAAPQLRELPRERAAALRAVVADLIRADGAVRTFDFALYHVLQRNLPMGGRGGARSGARGAGGRGPVRPTARTPLHRLQREAEVLLSAIAWAGAGPEDVVVRAFREGTDRLPERLGSWTLHPRDSLGLDRVDEALDRMERGAPAARKALLEAAAAIVQADGEVDVEEAELFRAVAEALDVPVPPLSATRSAPPRSDADAGPSPAGPGPSATPS
jgi:Zn-dependent protease with chaperone function